MANAEKTQDAGNRIEEELSSDSNGKASGRLNDTAGQGDANHEESPKTSKLKKIWAKTGLSLPILMIMLKAAVPQTVAIAMYQSKSVASEYTTLGYLVAIASVLGFCIMPRAKFVQTMTINIIAICVGDAVALLAMWTAVKARQHTTPPGEPPQTYNSSASAVCGIWLFFQVYLVNALRSARPQLQFPAILYSIFINVAMTYAPAFPDMSACISFAKQLLEAFLTGFALATGVSLFLPPITQRSMVFKEMAGYVQGLRGLLKAQIKYTASLEQIDMFKGELKQGQQTEKKAKSSKQLSPTDTPEAIALKAAVQNAKSLHSKLSADLPFAKREIAYGKMGADDLSQVFTLFRNVFLPLIGMPTLIDMFKRIAHMHGWDKPDGKIDEIEQTAVEDWQDAMKLLHKPLAEISAAMDKAFEHVLLRLELSAPPKKKQSANDEEAKPGSSPQPGSDEFAAWFEREVKVFYESRKVTLRQWCDEKGIPLPPDSFETNAHWVEQIHLEDTEGSNRQQRQAFVVLYIEYLLHTAGIEALELVKHADAKVSDGTLKQKKIILPGLKRLRKWIGSAVSANEDANESSYTQAMDGAQDIYLGEAFSARKDPEHLPPQNVFEKIGNVARMIPRALRSPHSVFGFRVACATMSVGIIAYLKDSASFFIQQRLVWAMIMIAISMTRTSGQSLFNFTLRVFGTICAMVASFLVYYIPDGHTAGIIVLMFFWEAACFYIVVKMPRFVVVGIISAITVILVIGYELQVRVLGVEAATANGQPAYGINLLAPYRVATVAGGLFVAWIWTIFPYPVTEHSELRKDLGGTLYLAANFYAIVHEMIGTRIRNDGGDPDEKSSPSHRLFKLAETVFRKELMLVERLHMYSGFSKFELSLGGRFPREKYDTIIGLTENVLNYSALMAYASRSFRAEAESGGKWLLDFRALLTKVTATSHEITTRLCLLSSAVSSGKPLPPYLSELQPFHMTQKLQEIDTDILSVRHIAEPGYAAFAVLQICARSILADLNTLTSEVKELVGELDFSFHYAPTVSSPYASFTDGSSSDLKGKKE